MANSKALRAHTGGWSQSDYAEIQARLPKTIKSSYEPASGTIHLRKARLHERLTPSSPRARAALSGAAIGAQYGASAGGRATTGLKHPRATGAAGGALVGAAGGAGVHSVWKKAHPLFQSSANHHTDYYVRRRNGRMEYVHKH